MIDDSTDHHLLVIVAADYDAAVKKGVESIFSQYDEKGFFSKVVLMSPYIRKDRIIKVSESIEMRELGFSYAQSFFKAFAIVHVFRFIWISCQLIRERNIDLIRATEPSICGLLAWIISRLSGVPYCISLHADYDQRYKLDGKRGAPTILGSRKLIYPIESFTLRNAVSVLPIRRSLIPYAIKRGVNRKYIGVIPHGINLDRYRIKSDINIRKKFNLPIDHKVLAFVGRLSSENYLDDLLLAVRNVCAIRKNVVLILAGGGPLEDYLAEKVEADPILSLSVHMVGYISPELVCALRQQCDVSMCLMAGFSLIEACAGGRPVVAYNVEWHHELVINGKTGYLVPEHDISAISKAINMILDDQKQANLMGQHARQLAFDFHDIESTTEIKRSHYAKILRKD